jgi:hypothetical protein
VIEVTPTEVIETEPVIITPEPYKGFVDVSIQPDFQVVTKGDRLKYLITVQDKHLTYECGEYMKCGPQLYRYKLHVDGLPYYTQMNNYIELSPGQISQIALYIDTSVEQAYAYTDKVPVYTVEKLTAAQKTQVTSVAQEVSMPKSIEQTQVFYFDVVVEGDAYDKASAKLAVMNRPVTPPTPKDTMTLDLQKGWNLVAIPADVGDIISGNEQIFETSPVFIYYKEEQRYMTLQEADQYLGGKMSSYMRANGFWVYIDTPQEIVISIGDKTGLDEINLVQGWSIIPVTYGMTGKSLDIVGPDCSIQRVYAWDRYSQQWQTLSSRFVFDGSMIGQSIIVKSANYCTFRPALAPPPMPTEVIYVE